MRYKFTKAMAIMLTVLSFAAYSQEEEVKKITVQGTITAAEKSEGVSKGDPLIGVTVSLKGTTKGIVTDIDGNYKLDNVPVGSTLVISYIGYAKQEIKIVDGRTDYSVQLLLDSKIIDEVVAVGYATQKKRDVTGATVSVSEKDMKLTLNTGLDQAMQGRTPGVIVTQSSGSPGAPASVNIRGLGSINGSQPLYVIDGVPVSYDNINLLNPNDVETMEILKDASAAAIYGARGANGVVLITTKSGKEGKGKIEYYGQMGVQSVWRKLDVLDADQYRQFYRDFYGVGSANSKQFYFNPAVYSQHANTDWQKEIFQQGRFMDHSLTARGGNEFAKYSIGMGYYSEEGTIKRSTFDRYTFRVNTEIKPKKWLKIGENMSFARSESFQGSDAEGLLQASTKTAPTINIYDPNNLGGFGGQIIGPTGTGSNDGINPVASINTSDELTIRNRILGNIYTEIEFIKGLKYRLSMGTDLSFNEGKNVRLPFRYGNTEGRFRQNKTIEYDRGLNVNWVIDNVLSYDKKIGRHDFSVLAGYSSQYFKFSGFNASGQEYRPELNTIGATLNNRNFVVGGSDNESSLIGYIGRINYAYNDKYLFTANIRYDGSSRFGSNYRFGLFPSFSAGWRISNEEFMKNFQWISDMKLRFGWGRTGNQDLSTVPNGDYLAYQVIYPDIIRYPIGSGQSVLAGGVPTQGLANPNLRWETVEQSNLGFDFSVFQNALQLNLDVFQKTSSDILIPVPLPDVSGASDAPFYNSANIFTNAGSVRNRGIEAALTYRNEKGKFKFSITPNITIVENRVLELSGNFGKGKANLPGLNGTASRTEAGAPINSFYGWVTDGIIRDTADLVSYVGYNDPNESNRPTIGDYKFKDLNGDGRITDADRTFLGKSIPTMGYGLNLRASYLGFDFSMFLQGVSDVQTYNSLRSTLEDMRGPGGGPPDANQLTSVLDAYSSTNRDGALPRAISNDPSQNSRPSDRWIENTDYLRIKSINIGYSIPEKALKYLLRTEDGISLRVFLAAQNLVTLTRYSGYDPELSNYSPGNNGGFNPRNTGFDNGTYPQAQKFMGGLQFTF